MQAKLPDVNAAIVRYRSEAVEAAQDPRTFDMAIICLAAINADLPENFKVEVNSEKYYSLVQDRKFVVCTHCKTLDKKPDSPTNGEKIPTECILADVEQYEIELEWIEQILSGKKTEHYWLCTSCGKPNIMDEKNIKIKKFQMPFYTQIIPSPPIKKRGIQGRNTYENEFKQWFEIALQEIESQISRYRTEYAAQQEEEEFNILEA